MRNTGQLPLIALLIASTLIIPASAITWIAPTYPFYASTQWHGPMYFIQGFTATNGSWAGGLLTFSHFNYASAGDFGTIGFAAGNDTIMALYECVPLDHILMQTSSAGTLRNITLSLPVAITANVTNAEAWNWSNATHLLHITAPIGIANIYIRFVGGTMPTVFYVPQWFIDQGGSFFGVANFFTQIMAVMAAFVAWFVQAVQTVISLIYSIASIIFFVAGTVIYWFAAFVNFWIAMFSFIGAITNGTSSIQTGLGDMWSYFGVATWVGFIPLVFTVIWFDSVESRGKKTGRSHVEILIADIQIIMYVVGTVWEWSWLIFSFVFNTIMTFVSLVWSLIP